MLRRPIVGFLARFVILYGILLLPFPFWNNLYGAYFRAMGTAIYTRESGSRIILFAPRERAPAGQKATPLLGTRMTLANRDLADGQGNGPAQLLDLDTRSIGWMPTALTIVLIMASPVTWVRRAWALLWGLMLVHLFILFSLQSWIWDNSPAVSLSALSPFWKGRADDLEYVLITQLGASFSVPVAIWIVVTFRRKDLVLLFDEFEKDRGNLTASKK